MFRIGDRRLLRIAASLLFAACSGTAPTVSTPSESAGPPSVLGRGTIAVSFAIRLRTRSACWSSLPTAITIERSYRWVERNPNSLAFDGRQHLYIGINDTGANRYAIREIDLPKFKLHREFTSRRRGRTVRSPWMRTTCLYVNTKAFVGGNIKMFKRGEREPSLEIKEPLSPVTTRVANNALWIGNEGFPSNVLTRYRLYFEGPDVVPNHRRNRDDLVGG